MLETEVRPTSPSGNRDGAPRVKGGDRGLRILRMSRRQLVERLAVGILACAVLVIAVLPLISSR